MKTNGNESSTGYGFTTADGSSHQEVPGLTKREHFAAMAMQGMYNNGVMTESGRIDRSPDGIALMAVQAADELIKALNK